MVFSVAATDHDWSTVPRERRLAWLLEATVHGATTTTTLPYNATQHKFWRLRHQPGTNTIAWETSADRVSWATLRTAAVGSTWPACRLELVAGTHQKESQPGIAAFDNVRVEPDTPAGMNKAPIADPGGPYTGTAGQPVQFNAAASSTIPTARSRSISGPSTTGPPYRRDRHPHLRERRHLHDGAQGHG